MKSIKMLTKTKKEFLLLGHGGMSMNIWYYEIFHAFITVISGYK